MDGTDLDRVVRRIAHEVLETHRGAEMVTLVGIWTRGEPLARRLAAAILEFESVEVPVAGLVIDAYRDDRESPQVEPRPAMSPVVDIGQRHVVIVDDVLYTGRTVRAALDALSDLGRAATTELAVMVDRGHRELPIRADYVGKNLPTARDERVQVRLSETDGEDGVWIVRAAA
jgi:pyrimidine operon attenuation protein/uracil phosphoribosyltransferase